MGIHIMMFSFTPPPPPRGLVTPNGHLDLGQHWPDGHKALSLYQNQCWLIINGVLWYSTKTNFTGSKIPIREMSLKKQKNKNKKNTNKQKNPVKLITSISPRGQWVKPPPLTVRTCRDAFIMWWIETLYSVWTTFLYLMGFWNQIKRT